MASLSEFHIRRLFQERLNEKGKVNQIVYGVIICNIDYKEMVQNSLLSLKVSDLDDLNNGKKCVFYFRCSSDIFEKLKENHKDNSDIEIVSDEPFKM